MALVNHAKKEVNAKLVFYGPPACGKQAALNYIYSRIKPALRGELRTVPAGSDNLLLFDFSPFDVPPAHGYHIRLHIYTLTGPVTNPATWRMTLKGADGIMVMVDSAAERSAAAHESIGRLRDFLSAYGVGIHETPAVLLCNNSQQPAVTDSATRFAAELGLDALPAYTSHAASGEGLLEALAQLSRLVLDRIVISPEPDETEQASEEEMPDAPETVPAPPTTAEAIHAAESSPLPVAVSLSGMADHDGHSVRIPLDISVAGTTRRLVVSIQVELD
jgi:signal recognition particle receptor subunit beta